MGTRVPPFLGLLRCPPNPVPTVLVVPKNCCQAFIFNYWKFASGPKTLKKMLSGVQFSMNEMLPVVPKKATNCWRGFICCGWNFEHSTVFGTAAAPQGRRGNSVGEKSKHRQNNRDPRHQVREIQIRHSQGASGENPRQNQSRRASGEKKIKEQHGNKDSEQNIEATMRSQSSAQRREGEKWWKEQRRAQSTAGRRAQSTACRRAKPTAGKTRTVHYRGKAAAIHPVSQPVTKHPRADANVQQGQKRAEAWRRDRENPLRTRKYLVTDRGDPKSILKKGHGLNNSSLETMKQKIIRESGEWSGAKKPEKNFKCYRKCGKTFYELVNAHVCYNGISSIHGKELPEQLSNTTDLTLKQMFDICTRLVCEQNEISGLETIGWENHSWKYLSLIGDERIINLQRTKVYVFSDSVLCLGKIFENPESNDAWEQRLGWIKSSQKIQKLWQNRRRANGIGVEYFPRIQHVAAQWRSQKFIVQIRRNTRKFHRKNSVFVDVQRHFLWNKRQWRRMSGKCSTRIFVCKKIWKRQLSFIGPGSEKKWYSISEDSPQGIWDKIAERMLLEFAESGRYTMQPNRKRLRHFFRIIVSANQLSLYGAVAEICEENESVHDGSGRPDKVMGQSIVLSEIKTEVPLENDDPAYQNFLLQLHEERIERLSQQDKLSKICMDAGFLSVVENGQYFMTKDTGDLTQFNTVACREYTRRSITTERMDPRKHQNWARIGSCN